MLGLCPSACLVKLAMMAAALVFAGCGDDGDPLPFCGDDVIQPEIREQCDDGNVVDGDGCSMFCLLEECGNGILDPGEQCDDERGSQRCNADCTFAECGDGKLNELAGETCEAGGVNTEECDFDCTPPMCGDGIHNPLALNTGTAEVDDREQCDDAGDSFACDRDCTRSECGDKFINTVFGEDCEPEVSGDNEADCDFDCTFPTCGDGIANPFASNDATDDPDDLEVCDSGQNTPNCDIDCTLPECGDGILNMSSDELCDDGNTENDDGCSAMCLPE